MRIGLNATALVTKGSVEAFVKHAQTAAADGFDSYWVAEHPTGGLDALTVLTVVGQSVDTMELGTAVIPTYPRHPMVLAGQAVTAQSAMQGPLPLDPKRYEWLVAEPLEPASHGSAQRRSGITSFPP